MYAILQMKSHPVYIGINTISTEPPKFHPFSKFQPLGQDFEKEFKIFISSIFVYLSLLDQTDMNG